MNESFPLAITDAGDDRCEHESDRVYRPLIGKACRIAIVGHLQRALDGEERVLVVFEDESITCTNRRPYGGFFIWQLASRTDVQPAVTPRDCVRRIAASPLCLEPKIDPLMTSRGGLVVNGYAGGSRAPAMPDHVLEALRRAIAHGIATGSLDVGV